MVDIDSLLQHAAQFRISRNCLSGFLYSPMMQLTAISEHAKATDLIWFFAVFAVFKSLSIAAPARHKARLATAAVWIPLVSSFILISAQGMAVFLAIMAMVGVREYVRITSSCGSGSGEGLVTLNMRMKIMTLLSMSSIAISVRLFFLMCAWRNLEVSSFCVFSGLSFGSVLMFAMITSAITHICCGWLITLDSCADFSLGQYKTSRCLIYAPNGSLSFAFPFQHFTWLLFLPGIRQASSFPLTYLA